MLYLLACFTYSPLTSPANAFVHAITPIDHFRTCIVACKLSGRQQLFDEVFQNGGKAIQDGDMARALFYFKQALAIDPKNAQTKKMVNKLELLGIVPVDPCARDLVAAEADGEDDKM